MCMTECLCVYVIVLCVYTVHSVNSISGSDGKHSSVKSTGSEGSCSLTTVDFKSFNVTWNQEIRHNRETWKAQAAKGSHTDLLNICHSNESIFTMLFPIFARSTFSNTDQRPCSKHSLNRHPAICCRCW